MLKPQLEQLLVTPSCVTALSIMNQPPCGSAHAGTKSMPGVLFQRVNEGRATSAVRYPKGASAFILWIQVCFLFQMWPFANLLPLSGVSNLDLKNHGIFSLGLNPQRETHCHYKILNLTFQFFQKTEVPKYFYNADCPLLKHSVGKHH